MADIAFKLESNALPALAKITYSGGTQIIQQKAIEYNNVCTVFSQLPSDRSYTLSVIDLYGNLVTSGITTPVSPYISNKTISFMQTCSPALNVCVNCTGINNYGHAILTITPPLGLSESFDVNLKGCIITGQNMEVNQISVYCYPNGSTIRNTIATCNKPENACFDIPPINVNFGDVIGYETLSVGNPYNTYNGSTKLWLDSHVDYDVNMSVVCSASTTCVNNLPSISLSLATGVFNPAAMVGSSYPICCSCPVTANANYEKVLISPALSAGQSLTLNFEAEVNEIINSNSCLKLYCQANGSSTCTLIYSANATSIANPSITIGQGDQIRYSLVTVVNNNIPPYGGCAKLTLSSVDVVSGTISANVNNNSNVVCVHI